MEFKILSNEKLAKSVWRMVLEGDTAGIRPGQFVEVALPGRFLRRPISVCDYTDTTLTLVYKVVGVGTEDMSRMEPGLVLDLLTDLGNGYSLEKAGDAPLLIGGGVGVPPLYAAAKALRAAGKAVTVILGFNTADEVFYEKEFAALGARVYVATADGSVGTKGFVTDVVKEKKIACSRFYACGPLPMLRAIAACVEAEGEMSFEERMGCGFGACMGCTLITKEGPKRVCADGPVFDKEEVLF